MVLCVIIKQCLIVEDDDMKTNSIKELLMDNYTQLNFVVKKSLNSGLDEVTDNQYDIVLLDMSLPLFEGKKSRTWKPFGGEHFLDEMERINIQIPVIVITQLSKFGIGKNEKSFIEVKKYCEERYKNCLGVLYYQDDSWTKELITIINS